MNTRQMPWKGEKDPYKIWLSEIILQQTRVSQGLEYYNKFIRFFPHIHKLAEASEEKIYKLWEGLGYYTRCRNLIETARFISKQKKGVFPGDYKALLELKGVGSYTAAAIASFAYNLPCAVVDGNVFRVLSRVFGIQKPIDTAEGRIFFTKLADELLDKKQPGIYNQALMDFGATVCKPVSPLCGECIFRNSCKAFTSGKISGYPLKKKKPMIKTRWFYYLVAEREQNLFILQRNEKDIWRNLFEFFLVEKDKETPVIEIIKAAEQKKYIYRKSYRVESFSPVLTQQLSHQKIKGQFIRIKTDQDPDLPGLVEVQQKKIRHYAFPKLINLYLQEHYR